MDGVCRKIPALHHLDKTAVQSTHIDPSTGEASRTPGRRAGRCREQHSSAELAPARSLYSGRGSWYSSRGPRARLRHTGAGRDLEVWRAGAWRPLLSVAAATGAETLVREHPRVDVGWAWLSEPPRTPLAALADPDYPVLDV